MITSWREKLSTPSQPFCVSSRNAPSLWGAKLSGGALRDETQIGCAARETTKLKTIPKHTSSHHPDFLKSNTNVKFSFFVVTRKPS